MRGRELEVWHKAHAVTLSISEMNSSIAREDLDGRTRQLR
jgi:hypothetical protein